MPKTKTVSKVKYEPVLQLPPLSYEEFTALRDNIAVNGVLVPILVDSDGLNRKIIDGNYRKQIADELGYDCPEIVQAGMEEDEKRVLARALNLARRQLNTDQKRKLIADQLKETPDKSLRWVAKMLGVHHATVGSVRGKWQSTGEISQLDTDCGTGRQVPPGCQAPEGRSPFTCRTKWPDRGCHVDPRRLPEGTEESRFPQRRCHRHRPNLPRGQPTVWADQ